MVVFESITVSQDLKKITFLSNVSVSTRMILRISYCQLYLYLSAWYAAVPAERNSKLTLAQRHNTCSQGFERCMNAPWPYSEQDVRVVYPTSSLCGLYFVHINFLSVKMNFNKGMLKYVWSCHSWYLQYGQKKHTTPSLTIKKYSISFTFVSFKNNFNKQTRPLCLSTSCDTTQNRNRLPTRTEF